MPDPTQDTEPKDATNTQDTGNQDGPVDWEARFKSADNENRHLKAQKTADSNRLAALEKAETDRKQAEMSELEKANQAKKEAEDRATAAEQRANQKLIEAAFVAEASRHGAKYPEDAYVLADKSGVSIDEHGKVIGAREAVAAVVKDGRLPIGTPRAPNLDGGAGGATAPNRAASLTPEEEETARKMGISPEVYLKSKTNRSATTPGQPDDKRI